MNSDKEQQRIGILGLAALALTVFVGYAVWQVIGAFAEETTPVDPPPPVSGEEDLSQATREEILRLNDAVQQKKQSVESLQQRISVLKGDIEKKRGQTVSLQNQLALLENRLAKTELDIEQTTTEIEQVNLEISALDLRIGERSVQIERRKAYLAEFVRTVARASDRSGLEVLLMNDSFSEFYDRLRATEEISKDMDRALNDVIAIKTALESEQNDKEQQRSKLDDLRKRLEISKSELSEEHVGKEQLALNLTQQTLGLQQDLSGLKSQQQSVDNDITTLENTLRRKLESSDKLKSIAGDSTVLSWPVDHSRGISAYFHDPDYPFRNIFEHPAIDIRAYQGTQVHAAAPGFVARAHDGGMGYSYVMLIHDDGISTVYGHVSRILVKEGQFVERGDIIALSGATPGTPGAGPLTTGPHLHFETRMNGIPFNPLDYLLK